MLGVAVVTALLDPDSGIRRWHQLRLDLESTRERIRDLDGKVARLRVESRELVDDEFAIERAIREDLFYARRNETLLRLDGPATRSKNRRKSPLTPR